MLTFSGVPGCIADSGCTEDPQSQGSRIFRLTLKFFFFDNFGAWSGRGIHDSTQAISQESKLRVKAQVTNFHRTFVI